MQNRSTNVHNKEMWKKNTFLIEHLPLADSRYNVCFLLELKKIDVRLKKKEMKFYKETLKRTNNIVQKQEQVAVSSTASVVKPSTTLCFSGKSGISNKNSSSGSREWAHNEIIELIAIIWKEEKAMYNRRHSVCSIKQEINNDTKQY